MLPVVAVVQKVFVVTTVGCALARPKSMNSAVRSPPWQVLAVENDYDRPFSDRRDGPRIRLCDPTNRSTGANRGSARASSYSGKKKCALHKLAVQGSQLKPELELPAGEAGKEKEKCCSWRRLVHFRTMVGLKLYVLWQEIVIETR
ncbi:hypothetical protein BDZ85DRAFT_294880 [Elsinoe ampelina]|uniref:Secreted protein n=1 Tax=Elsinoe ampelina TaxID=302913 RepID=A0A6A6GHI6_9PEZI|nr:hypothetical protein BDZ85DRAFT_294880 [Elsinoe ampelina]